MAEQCRLWIGMTFGVVAVAEGVVKVNAMHNRTYGGVLGS